jgi:hypothetical protein
LPISDIVNVAITSESSHVTQEGFGVPLVLSPTPAWVERTRSYTDLAGMVIDGFGTTSPEYKMVAELFSQKIRPVKVIVGRCANKPTQRFAVTPNVTNSTGYKLKVNGTEVLYTSDASATAAEIIDGLKAAIDLLGLAITTSNQGPNTFLRIVANTAGAFFSVEPSELGKLEVVQDHADPGLAADLAAIKLENNDWYDVKHLFNSKLCIEAIAGYIEANGKIFIAQTQDTTVATTAKAGTDDVAESLQASAYARTALIFHPKTDAFADGGWAGRCLPLQPGSETWKFKTLAGVPAVTLTSTQRANLKAKSCNFYETVGGVNITEEGVVSAGEFIDVIRFRDWLVARMQERIFGTLTSVNKVPYTNKGVATITADVRAQLQEGVDAGGLSDDPAPTAQGPKVQNVSNADKVGRVLNNVKFDAVLAGAIHAVNLSGTVAV